MIVVRKASERGHTQLDWLDSWHSFSFSEYYDPAHMHYGPLRVINDDTVAAGGGFGMHSHRDMEIVTVVLEGALEHRDSMGNGSVIRPGDVQVMSAGSGLMHSEFNHSKEEPVHFHQVWIMPAERGLKPSYAEARFDRAANRLTPIVSPDGRDGSLVIHQDAAIYTVRLEPGERVEHPIAPGRKVWAQVARGGATVNGIKLDQGDGAAIENEPALSLTTEDQAELLVFDLA